MALVLTTVDYNEVSTCETATGWSDGTLDSVMKIQGSNCLSAQVKITTSAVYYISAATANFTGLHLYAWMQVTGLADTKANGGFRVVLDDGTNVGTWYVGGGLDNLGWNCFVIDPASPPTLWDGGDNSTNQYTLDASSISTVGVQFKTLTSAVGQSMNCFWDFLYACSGFKLTSGASDQVALDDIAAASATSAFGCMIKEKSGAFLTQGTLYMGDSSGVLSFDFAEENGVLAFPENELVATDFYQINLVSNATGTTNFEWIGGLIVSNGNPFTFDALDTDLTSVAISGATLLNAADISFSSVADITNNTFNGCAQIIPGTAIFQYNTISNSADAGGAILWPTSGNTSNCNFIENVKGIEITQVVNQSFASMTFDDVSGKYDVHLNNGGTSIAVAKTGTSDPNSYIATGGGIVSFTASYTLNLTDLVAGINLTIVNSSTRVELKNELMTGTSTSYVHSGGETVDILLNGLNVDPNSSDVYDLALPSADSSIQFQLSDDDNYYNP